MIHNNCAGKEDQKSASIISLKFVAFLFQIRYTLVNSTPSCTTTYRTIENSSQHSATVIQTTTTRMGRRNRSSSIVGNNNNHHHMLPSTFSSSSSSTTKSSTLNLPTHEEVSACNSLLKHFVHSPNHNGGELGRTTTPFQYAVVAAASSAAPSRSSNDDDDAIMKEERKRMDGLFMVDALATRMKEMDRASSSNNHNAGSSLLLCHSPSIKKKKGQTNSTTTNNNNNNNKNSNSNNSSNNNGHFHRIMTTPDQESGYTPLHYSILQRDLFTLLLLLKHASSTSSNTTLGMRREVIGGNGVTSSLEHHYDNILLNLHPLRLLDGNLTNNDDKTTHHHHHHDYNDSDTTTNNQYQVMNEITSTRDKEGFTPLQLLGRTSCIGLEYCRRSLSWRVLKDGWKRMKMHQERQQQFQQQQRQQWQQEVGISTSSSMEETTTSPPIMGRYRRRMISFGDDRDYDSLQYDIDSGGGSGDNIDDDERRRVRGGSFNIDLEDDHYSDDDDDEEESGDNNNDLIPLEDVDFNLLADANNNNDDDDDDDHQLQRQRIPQQQRRQQQQQQSQRSGRSSHTTNDYGCEVLTFGRADHCALGVPQLSSRIRSDYNNNTGIKGGGKDDGGNNNNNIFSSSSLSFDKTYKPKRVETFALGELRRNWSSSSSSSSSSFTNYYESDDSSSRRRRDRRNGMIDSPAVAVAASTHHTLVTTRSGQVFSFGLGKGGRLGLGDESHRPLPTRILGPLTKRIVASIAAAENHSLCSTSDGAVFAWGSNGFGQLGIHSSSSSSRGGEKKNPDGTTTTTTGGGGGGSRLSPRRVEGELKHSFVVGVACGERHSVALTRLGEVFCWGDNKKGQLGVINVSEMQSNGPQRVEGLWSVHPRRRAIAISAAAYSTLVLTMPPTVSAGAERESSLASLPVNTIYGWGHGNHSPLRVVFPSENSFASQSGSSNAYSRMVCINPTAIACAKYHNVAITKDGKVYTWGLHSDSLGVPQHASSSKQKSRSSSVSGLSSSSIISSPQLVTGMLPENGGGNAVAVSASESHTAIVTSDGHLFTWGESEGKDVLGHKGVRWQPSPRRVKRVHRAVAVAAGKEHTVLLMGTTFPPLPNANSADGPPSLQASAAIEISRNVDLFNVIPISLVAYRFNCRPLINFCDEFMRSNLDGVLAVGMKNDFDTFLSSRTIVGTEDYERDDIFHPFLHLLVNTKRWVYSGRQLLKQYESAIVPPTKKAKRNVIKRERKPSVARKEEENKSNEVGQDETCAPVCINENGTSKNNESMTPTNLKKAPETQPKADLPPPVPTAGGKYYCDLCGISCPDSDSFTFHIHGRKHRNRKMHAEAAEEKKVAESMMALKRMQLVGKSGEEDARIALEKDTKQNARSNIAWAVQNANFSGGLSPVTPQKGKSFQDILKEEQKNMAMNTALSRKGKSSPHMGTKSPASFIPAKTNSAPLSSPVAHNKFSPVSKSSSGTSPTLGSFIERRAERKQDGISSIGASWGATPVTIARNSNLNWGMKQPAMKASPITTQSPPKTRSFSEIQKEEEAIRNNEDRMCRIDGNQWYVQQRERAASIGEIQQQEQQEQEMLDLIEEQKQIEMAIMKSIQEEKDAKKKKQKKKQQSQQRRNKKKQLPTKSPAKAKSPTPS